MRYIEKILEGLPNTDGVRELCLENGVTDEISVGIVLCFAGGMSLGGACKLLGMSTEEFHGHITPAVQQCLLIAEGFKEARRVGVMENHAGDDWKSALTLLERDESTRDRWGARPQVANVTNNLMITHEDFIRSRLLEYKG